MTKEITHWCGKSLETMSREELIEAFRFVIAIFGELARPASGNSADNAEEITWRFNQGKPESAAIRFRSS